MGSTGVLAKVLPTGFFTADTAQENWGKVGRTMNPAFALPSVRNMLDEMLDIKPHSLNMGATRVRESDGLFIPALHRDQVVFGDDAVELRPERLHEGNFEKLPKNSFKLFRNYLRSCIGSHFAMQEITVAVAILFQKFDFALVNPSHERRYQPSLNRKPKGLLFHACVRPDIDILSLHRDLFVPAVAGTKE
ncbi:hypothetical protein SLS62_007986 [Diatrype stigma]|uniref:Cytochrome P450 n=1 Tax=Diatrype stigma TaxID=117547 RepID=A0AAN9UME8_9PEZI